MVIATKQTTCQHCHDTLYIDCPECGGGRTVGCLLCHGSGTDRRGAGTCIHCAGDGRRRCLCCQAVGEIRCPACYSTHRLG